MCLFYRKAEKDKVEKRYISDSKKKNPLLQKGIFLYKNRIT